MQVLIGMVVIMGIVAVITYYERKNEKRKIYKCIREGYGKIPTVTNYPYKQIAIYWNISNNRIPDDEKIDDITWNDLEMIQIFNRINSTKSYAGEQMLYGELHHLPKDKNHLTTLEEEISYYETHNKEREEMQFLLWKLGKEKVSYYLPMFMNNLEMHIISNIWMYKVMQILLFLSILPGIISGKTVLFGLTGIIFLINIAIYAFKKAKYEVYLNTLGDIIRIVKLAKIVACNQKEPHKKVSPIIKEKLKLFDKLTRMIATIQKKKQASMSGDILGLLQDYLIGSTLWDFIKYDKIVRYLQGKHNEFMDVYKFIAQIDMEIAIASFRQSIPLYCTPQFTHDKTLDLEAVYHPLIENPIYNSLKIEKNCLITGSNASGKSTFIKAVAINVILAQNIHTCLAKKIVLPDIKVITSMAIKDDIMAGESYYIKEIKYLKRIITDADNGRFVLCVIDEILRGTNTEERIAASAAVLNYLNKRNCLTIVASHDIELTHILQKQYALYYFCEQMGNKDIIFDFKIHSGISNSRNAIRLLEYAGFPKEIVDEAKKTCNIGSSIGY